MKREDFFNQIAADYFQNKSANFTSTKQMIASIMPVFGELKVEITEENDGNKKLIFTDVDRAAVIFPPEGYTPTKEDWDMSAIFLKLTVDKDGVIKIAEHGISFFTPANKELVLFLGFLIGKKIIF